MKGKADTRVDKETRKIGGIPGTGGYKGNVVGSRLNKKGDMNWRGSRGGAAKTSYK